MVPYRESSLPPIVSNTYENGKGIIKCDSDITFIRDYAFGDCTGLTSVFINNSVINLGEGAFIGCTGLKNILIGNSVTTIWPAAFRNCYSLTSITIPNSVTSIGNLAFRNCSSLTSITIPNSITDIGDNAFIICDNLKTVTINSESIAYKALLINIFGSQVTKYVIGDGVSGIGYAVFHNC